MLRRALILAAATLMACDAPGTGPTPRAFTFCEPINWLAMQFDDEPWHYGELTGNKVEIPDGVERLTIASRQVHTFHIYSLAADEIPDGECSITPFVAGGSTPVSVEGVESGDEWELSAGGQLTSGTGSGSSQVSAPAGSGWNVFATVRTPQINVMRSVIVRRNVSMLAPLDFAGVEAHHLAFAEISVSNADGTPSNQTFYHPDGFHPMIPQGTATTRYYGIPAALLRPNEYHTFSLYDWNRQRGLRYFYVHPNDTTIAMGPEIAAHTASAIATEPCFLPQIEFPAQLEYPSFARVSFSVDYGNNDNGSVVQVVTAGFLGGTPTTWKVQVPRITMNGSDLCILPDNPQQWSAGAGAGDGRLGLLLRLPGDREVLRWGGF